MPFDATYHREQLAKRCKPKRKKPEPAKPPAAKQGTLFGSEPEQTKQKKPTVEQLAWEAQRKRLGLGEPGDEFSSNETKRLEAILGHKIS